MATADDFRRLALTLEGAEEGAHMGHADFRVRGRIFATLGAPGPEWGMVALGPDEQEVVMAAEPDAFKPAAGAWGRKGSTLLRLDSVREWLELALKMAWERRAAPKR